MDREARQEGLEGQGMFYGIYRGFVADNEDPEFLGRLKLKVPQIYGEDEVPDYWAWSKGIYAGNQVGFFAIPNIDDGVWVSFENGDPNYPVWEYGWWGENEVPTAAKNNGNKPTNNVWQTKSGNRIEMDDKDGIIRLTNKTGHIIEMNDNSVSVIAKSGKRKISLGTLDGSAEPAVLGDTLETFLKEFMDDLGNLKTIITSNGVTNSINTAANWTTFKSKWDSKWKEFKSSVVSLDKN
jgi:uncharacterized protein involved in type VI secretion and phage assembly